MTARERAEALWRTLYGEDPGDDVLPDLTAAILSAQRDARKAEREYLANWVDNEAQCQHGTGIAYVPDQIRDLPPDPALPDEETP
jgi:hypothetical protein